MRERVELGPHLADLADHQLLGLVANTERSSVDSGPCRDYRDYTMTRRRSPAKARTAHALEFKVVPIGNSRGIRLPKTLLAKYAFGDAVIVEQREEGLLLRSKKDRRLSWDDTFKAMAHEREDWSDLDGTLHDGLDREP